MFYGLLNLNVSTWILAGFKQEVQGKWMHAYIDAMSFRTNHYFTCYIAQASALASGFDNQSSLVVNPFRIELPRSLAQVAVSWNRPMHQWLKQCKVYNFRNLYQNF